MCDKDPLPGPSFLFVDMNDSDGRGDLLNPMCLAVQTRMHFMPYPVQASEGPKDSRYLREDKGINLPILVIVPLPRFGGGGELYWASGDGHILCSLRAIQ